MKKTYINDILAALILMFPFILLGLFYSPIFFVGIIICSIFGGIAAYRLDKLNE